MADKDGQRYYLMCERDWVYHLLIIVGGFWGAYTYRLRGGVFCNAQTGNVVLMGVALGGGDWAKGLYYLIPISAYMAGAFFSELLPNPLKRRLPIRWDTLLIGIELFAVLLLGFVPDTAPVQIAQVAINFIASMQYNTFRQSEGVPMATTFVTNHIRMVGVEIAKAVLYGKDRNPEDKRKLSSHTQMLLYFFGGAIIGSFCSIRLRGHAIWLTMLPLSVIFLALLHADLTTEKDLLKTKPRGH